MRPIGYGFEARFAATGVSVTKGSAQWSMSLRGYGYGSLKLVSAVTTQVLGGRVEYQRGAMTEWYANDAGGLEQGFTVREQPGNNAGRPLRIAIDLAGTLTASLHSDSKGLTLSASHGETLQYAGLATYDTNGNEVPSWLELRDSQLCINVADANAAYPITIDPKLEATLTATGSSYLGAVVRVSGNTVVSVGSNGVYVYSKPSTGWTSMTQTAVLSASNGVSFYTAAVSGNTIAATNGSNVYVFVEPAGGWVNMTETAVLTASDNPPDGLTSIALTTNTIVAGAPENGSIGARYPPGQPATSTGPGAAYVFVKPSGGWVNTKQTAKLTASDGQISDDFGWSVSVAGNIVAVGAPNASINGNNLQGAVYVFVKPAGPWANATQTAKLSGTAPEFVNVLGQSVSISGNTILAGGYGQADVFVEPAGGWANATVQNASLSDAQGRTTCQRGGCYGYSVSLDNNYAMVGAPGRFSPGGNSAVDIYQKPTTGWTNMTQTFQVHSPVDTGDYAYGYSVSVSGNTFVVGYPNVYGSGNYVFVY